MQRNFTLALVFVSLVMAAFAIYVYNTDIAIAHWTAPYPIYVDVIMSALVLTFMLGGVLVFFALLGFAIATFIGMARGPQ